MRPFGLIELCCLGCFGCNVILGLDGLEADRGPGAAGSGANGSGANGSGASGSGASSSGGEAGQGGGCTGVCGTSGCGTCPATPAVAVSTPNGDYQIDALEVTVGQYAAWLATDPSTVGQGPRCTGNDSFVPGVVSQAARDAAQALGQEVGADCDGWLGKQSALDQNRAIACVDWCDAVAYCVWAGRHLCGRIGGGTIDITPPDGPDANDPTQSEWYAACSQGGAREYPYAGAYDAQNCKEGAGIHDVGSEALCEGGYPGIFDMSGNVLEWEDACTNHGNGEPLEQENCVRRGGAHYSAAIDLACPLTAAQLDGTLPGLPSDGTGFRCCSP